MLSNPELKIPADKGHEKRAALKELVDFLDALEKHKQTHVQKKERTAEVSLVSVLLL